MRTKCALAFCLPTALAIGITTDAAQPTFFEADVNLTTVSPFFSAACGFIVSITEVGTVKATIITSTDDAIISEIDTQPGYVVTYSSSASGKEFSFPFATVFHYEFPEGTTPGSPAIVTATGLLDKVPGVSAEAGRVTYGDATVLFVDANGVPIVDYGPATFFTGRVNDLFTVIEAGCAALAP